MGPFPRGGVTRPAASGPRLRSGAFAALLILALPALASAQEPRPDTLPAPPRDTTVLAPDTVALPQDTVPQDTLAVPPDTVPPPRLPALERAGATGFAGGVWEWDRAALLRESPLMLGDLLERVPGTALMRHGGRGQPEAATAYGLTAGRVEVFLDGFALDPLREGVFDLARLELVHLEHVRVERRPGALRIDLRTVAPLTATPITMVEAGTGEPRGTDLLRGLFLTPHFLFGPFGLAFERFTSEGIDRQEPATGMGGWFRWGLHRGSSGLELELRQNSFTREGRSPFPEEVTRRDWVLRGRAVPLAGLSTELFAGRATERRPLLDLLPPPAGGGDDDDGDDDEVSEPLPAHDALAGFQFGGRAAFATDRVHLTGAARMRDHERLARAQVDLAGLVRLPLVELDGELRWEDWRGESAVSWSGRAVGGPFLGVRPFAGIGGGERGSPWLRDSAGAPVIARRTHLRAGLELDRPWARGGFAFVRLDADSVPALGLPFDTLAVRMPPADLEGIEVWARLPVLRLPFALEGSYTRWQGAQYPAYLPAADWRARLVYHHLPLPTGNLEIFARLEGRRRGTSLVLARDWVPGAVSGDTLPVPMPMVEEVEGYNQLDAHLHIRVLDVQAFVRWEDVLGTAEARHFPRRVVFGPRVFYGVRWQFWN
jgi:hypothetical protein